MNELSDADRIEHDMAVQEIQDEADGRALRLLREAAGRYKVWVEQNPVYSEHWSAYAYTASGPVVGLGSTIAEAADKCREALT